MKTYPNVCETPKAELTENLYSFKCSFRVKTLSTLGTEGSIFKVTMKTECFPLRQ